jgi:hypothetical protein
LLDCCWDHPPRLDAAWPALAALVLVVAGGVLDRQNFRGSIEWGYLIFFGVLGVVAARLALPQIPAMYLLCLALVPAAPRFGLSPWVAGFVIQLAAYTWLHARQSDYYRLIRSMTRGGMTTEQYGIIAGIGVTVATLVAIAASVAYWRMIGILPP